MPELSENIRGAALMAASMAAFTLNDACMKSLADELPLVQAIFLRGLATTVMLFAIASAMGGLRLRLSRSDWRLIAIRAAAEVGAAYFFLTALFNMPIANATAILQALPLAITLAGALFLGEAVGWRRLTAILVGFCGVLLIVRPGTEGFNVFSVYVLITVALVTLRDLIVRRMGRHVPSVTVALIAAASVTLAFGVASAFIDWAPVSRLAASQLAGASVFVIGGYLFSVMAMRRGEVAVVAPFRYTSLLWALLLGFVVFGEWPHPPTLIGAALVIGTGLFVLWRESGTSSRLAARAAQR